MKTKIYSVAATVGQAAAGGPMAAGKCYSTAGFWEVPAGPGLTIEFTAPDTIVSSWPAAALGWFALQATTSLSAPQWEDMANPVRRLACAVATTCCSSAKAGNGWTGFGRWWLSMRRKISAPPPWRKYVC